MPLEIPRDHFDRPLVIPADGGKPKAYRRCTTFIDVLGDRSNLEKWKQRQVAVGLTKRNDLLMRAAAASDKRTLNYVCEAALQAAGSDASANIGTAIHDLTERIDRGETPEIPALMEKEIQAYLAVMKAMAVKSIEVFVVHDGFEVGGTFDRIVEYQGQRYVADIKTGSIDFDAAKIAMQLAVYANSQTYDIESGARTPLDASTEKGLVIHLPQGTGKCSLHWADLEAGWQGAQLAADVWAWRKRKGLLSPVAA